MRKYAAITRLLVGFGIFAGIVLLALIAMKFDFADYIHSYHLFMLAIMANSIFEINLTEIASIVVLVVFFMCFYSGSRAYLLL